MVKKSRWNIEMKKSQYKKVVKVKKPKIKKQLTPKVDLSQKVEASKVKNLDRY